MKLNLLPDLTTRRREPELMDQPELDEQRHRGALDALGRINALRRTARLLWPPLRGLSSEVRDRPVRILDVACGGGDVAIRLARLAARHGIGLEVAGCDLSPVAVDHARMRARKAGAAVGFFQCNVLASELPAGFDAVVCSLFLHHLGEEDAVRLLRRMAEAAGSLVLVDDLIRSRSGYLLARLGSRLLTRSQIVHVDAPLSVAAAYTPKEVNRIADEAGLRAARITRHWPQRFLLAWRKR